MRDLNQAENVALEDMIARAGVGRVLRAIADICEAKASHYRANGRTWINNGPIHQLVKLEQHQWELAAVHVQHVADRGVIADLDKGTNDHGR
jgi:hypothetical protein